MNGWGSRLHVAWLDVKAVRLVAGGMIVKHRHLVVDGGGAKVSVSDSDFGVGDFASALLDHVAATAVTEDARRVIGELIAARDREPAWR